MILNYTAEELEQIAKNTDAIVQYIKDRYYDKVGSGRLAYMFNDGDLSCELAIFQNHIRLRVGYSFHDLEKSDDSFEERSRIIAAEHLLRKWPYVKHGLEAKWRDMEKERYAITYGFEL